MGAVIIELYNYTEREHRRNALLEHLQDKVEWIGSVETDEDAIEILTEINEGIADLEVESMLEEVNEFSMSASDMNTVTFLPPAIHSSWIKEVS
jgi:hypothetical protein